MNVLKKQDSCKLLLEWISPIDDIKIAFMPIRG